MQHNSVFSSTERQATLAIGVTFAARMLGLFMVLPAFSLYANSLIGATPLLLGIAFGIYGLTQACLQIPFGYLSDHYGRSIIIGVGLFLFLLGSIICGMTDSIYWMIVGRALQGAGAIGSALLALLADLTSDEKRIKAMAIVGMFIGGSAFIGMLLGSLLSSIIGMAGLFWLTAGFATIGIAAIYFWIPKITTTTYFAQLPNQSKGRLFQQLLGNPELIRLNFGTFSQHMIFAIWLYTLPFLLQEMTIMTKHSLWLFYLPTLTLSFLVMLPIIFLAQKKDWLKEVMVIAVLVIAIIHLLMSFAIHSLWSLSLCFFIYLIAFNLLEAWLPSLTTKVAPLKYRGTAMGIYSTLQFLGIFCGGLASGWLQQYFSSYAVFYACAIISIVWLAAAITMRLPKQYATSHLATTLE